MRVPVVRFALVFLLSPLCAMVGEALFDEVGLRPGWLLTLSLITSSGLWSVRQIWNELAALPRSEWLFLDTNVMLAIGITSMPASRLRGRDARAPRPCSSGVMRPAYGA